jgi:hypothetical protein
MRLVVFWVLSHELQRDDASGLVKGQIRHERDEFQRSLLVKARHAPTVPDFPIAEAWKNHVIGKEFRRYGAAAHDKRRRKNILTGEILRRQETLKASSLRPDRDPAIGLGRDFEEASMLLVPVKAARLWMFCLVCTLLIVHVFLHC